ncbi:guanylate-binding protein 1-like [Mercenaria mercenaria]|uniref:guanylate-binding protein 1-like n=1 Tax=Mercenaria mercenaria TaxID=6596 RepID=UPI00234EA8AC|nr:guanylate-binding protein 1-like [Mercenaria mercenaria]
MMSAFNQDAVEKLTFITEMSKNINFKSRSEMDQYSGDKLALILPTFVLCVRDFSLALVKDGVKISADQYLEDCLDLKPGKDNDAEKYNRPRKCIRKYFPTRRCFTFDRPGDREIMQKLETVHVKDLSKSFVEDTECFIHFVYGCKGKVLLSSKPVRGIMLASLMESYVHAIQNGAVPDVDDAISVVSKLENRRASDKAIQSFSQQLKRIKLPVIKKDDFRKLFQSIQESSLLTFRQDAMFDTEPFEKEAAMKMEELWRKTSTENMRLIQKHCYDQLLDVYNNSVGKRMRSGEYNVAGGYSIYRIELYDMKINYNNRTKNVEYYQTQHVLQKFLEDEVINERKIMMADQKLTEADRKRELDKIQKENQQAQTEQKKLFQTMLKEEKDRSDKHLAKMEKDRQMYLKQEQDKMKILMDKWKDQKELSEKQIQMMTTENEKQREEFKLEIKRLNDEILVRERECEERFEKLLEKEQMKNRMQHVEMKETFDSLLEMEKEDKKKMAQEMQIFRSELQKTKQEKDEERQKHEKEKRSLEQEKEKAKRQAECESKEKKKAMEEKELLTSANEQLELEKKQTTKENERLENEKAQLAKAKIKEEERRKASENKVERMKNRGLLDRILDVDV